jgi:uncharacterized protein YgbK (DUF1537 family)
LRAIFLLAALPLVLTGCAGTSTIPLSQDSFQISASAAPICGSLGAQQIAFKQAAAETIRRGYDRFVIMGGEASASVVGTTPIMVQRTGYGSAMVTGGRPMVSHGQDLVVKMFRPGDPAGVNALSARDTLGPEWQEIVKKPVMTCM